MSLCYLLEFPQFYPHGYCILTDIAVQLRKDAKKFNSVEHLTRHLDGGIPAKALHSYLSTVRKWISDALVVHIDDSDIVKPKKRKFKALGFVTDCSKSSDTKNVYEKGYHMTEDCILTKNSHPVSIISHLFYDPFLKRENFTSINDITFSAMKHGVSLLEKTTFIINRRYYDSKMFFKLNSIGLDYVIRLTAKCNLFFHGK